MMGKRVRAMTDFVAIGFMIDTMIIRAVRRRISKTMNKANTRQCLVVAILHVPVTDEMTAMIDMIRTETGMT